MRALLTALALLAAVQPVLGEEPAPPDPSLYVDPKPAPGATAYACTIETLLKNQPCTFESEATPGSTAAAQAKENVRLAGELAIAGCARAGRLGAEAAADKDLLSLCQKDVAKVAKACANDGSFVLADGDGRFTPAARPCYFAIGEALRKARLTSSVAGACCRCAAEHHCPGSLEQCHRAAAGLRPEISTCASAACAEECAALVPSQPSAPLTEEPPAAPAPRERRSSLHPAL